MSTANGSHASSNGAATSEAQAWHEAVDAVVARARKYYGKSLDNRITQARHYLLSDDMEVDGQFAYIASESYPGTQYTVSNDGCDCQDAEHTAPQGLCAHRLAWDIYRSACKQGQPPRREAPEPIPNPYTDPAPPMVEPIYEAPMSITMRGTLAGIPDTLVTIRGRNMKEIAARAAAVKAGAECLAGMFDDDAPASEPPEEPPEPAGSTDEEEGDPYCYKHDTPYVRHEKDGQIWWSHRVDKPKRGEKEWCRYRPAEQA
ncbi:MAG: hypothetical protein ETSY1_37485 [Candidatus Entotheonella factor]|uniref:SWIM-type domain-containing protein n=1 Tax=Entotheonella factor TaxID=1429438 RepID=W4L7H0_ENTF1|nr:MAG: hypothetical protein ETSY1_37485 [Candidatus Entotheonella factor]